MQGRTFVSGRLIALCLMAGTLAASPAAQASPPVGSGLPVTLSPRDQVTLIPRANGDYGVVQVRPVAGEPEAVDPSWNATQEYMVDSHRPQTFTAPEGTVRFSFWAEGARGAWLKLENNLGRPIIYSAELVRRGQTRSEPTTICSVASGQGRYEIWAEDLTAIRITGFYAVTPGSEVCGYPERGELSAPPPTAPAPDSK